MITIVFSRKGGGGKSTLVAQLASQLARNGESVGIIDTDPLGTIGNWSVYRREHEGLPTISLVATKHGADLDYAIQQLSEKHAHVIVDLQGGDTKENRETLKHADKIIVPMKPTQPDLDTLHYVSDMMHKLQSAHPHIEVHFVLNEAGHSNAKVTPIDEARAYFAGLKLVPLRTVVFRRKAYQDSMSTGKGACELKDGKAKAEIEGLWSEIYATKSFRKRRETTRDSKRLHQTTRDSDRRQKRRA